MPRHYRSILRLAATLAVVGFAAWLRLPALRDLPYDIDERVYYPLAQRYALAWETGDWATLRNPFDNAEHPALAKLLFGAAIAAPAGPAPQGAPGFYEAGGEQPPGLDQARMVSLLASLLLAGLLAWQNPLAGLAFALSSWQVKYGTVAYLEAVPGLLAGLAILCLDRWWRRAGPNPRTVAFSKGLIADGGAYLIAAAGLIGAAAAAKYPYAIIAAPTLVGCALVRRPGWNAALAGVAAGLIGFAACNPFLWSDPAGYVRETVAFHFRYSGNDLVQSQHFAPWHNLALLFKPMPYDPFFPFSFFNQLRIEGLLTGLGLLGLPFLWRRSPPLGLWLALGLLFLLGWPTKWAHYTLLVIPALSLSAGNLLVVAAGKAVALRRQTRS